MKNKQVLIDSLPEGKLVENNYKLVESEMPKASSEEIIVKTISFAITAGTGPDYKEVQATLAHLQQALL